MKPMESRPSNTFHDSMFSWITGRAKRKKEKKNEIIVFIELSRPFFFSASLALFIYGDVGANKVLDDGGGCLPFGTSVGPPSFLLLLKQHVFHREWRTLSSTLPHHVPYLPRIFKTSIFRHCTYLSRFPTGFVFPFHFYAISRMKIGRAHCKKKKRNWARIEWIFDFPLNLELESGSCLVQNLSLQSILSASGLRFGRNVHLFIFPQSVRRNEWSVGVGGKHFACLCMASVFFFLFLFDS